MSKQIYIETVTQVKKIVDKEKPGRKVCSNYQHHSSRVHLDNRYIQVETAFPNMANVHYEYYRGHWNLHFEPENSNDGYKYVRIIRFVHEYVVQRKLNTKIEWIDHWMAGSAAQLKEDVNSEEDLKSGLLYMCSCFDGVLEECAKKFKPIDVSRPYEQKEELKSLMDLDEEVSLATMSIQELFLRNLVIPPYQRIYCWQDKNIQTLWHDLEDMPEGQTYHLGTIIIQNRNSQCEIIDGQQRLVTLTLILRALGYVGSMPLLRQSFKSKEACNNISNAKFVIECLKGSEYEGNAKLLDKISKNLIFSVLVLNSDNLDLAYTFFSNQNSKGVRLSDYDVLKAHHLRFLVYNEKQAEHLARRWNAMSQECDSNNDSFVNKTLGLHLYRIRKWMRHHSCDEKVSSRPIKDEYSAAPLISGIPPFGERFYFYEKIQGGAHFFAYTDHFVELYKEFVSTPHVYLLRKHLLGESHWKYESVIESILFAYFSKFGVHYLSEALFCISGVVAQHRYTGARAIEYKINAYVQSSELIMMIDQASSPSFFLAESMPLIEKSGKDLEGGDIKVRFYYCLQNIFKGLYKDDKITSDPQKLRMAAFSEIYIESKKINEYE